MRIDRVKLATAMAREDIGVNALAEKTGLSRYTITAVKNGKSCSERTAQKISAVLGKGILPKEAR